LTYYIYITQALYTAMRSPIFLTAATFAVQAVALPTGEGRKESRKGESEQEAKTRADAVKAAFQTAWDGYYELVFATVMAFS
jgi:hypothetical protein